MGRPSKALRSRVVRAFDRLPQKILRYSNLAVILAEQRTAWGLPLNMNVRRFISFLADYGKLKTLDFPFPQRPEQRYVWGNLPLLQCC